MTHSSDLSFSKESATTTRWALSQEEPLLFEFGSVEKTGTDWPRASLDTLKDTFLNGQRRKVALNLPGLSEPETVRHYTRLSQKNYGIDTGIYPLGSCTMKHNPRLNEKIARMVSDIHPLRPRQSVQGTMRLMEDLANALMALTGMTGICLSPAAGAHGEFCGLMTIQHALKARKETRRTLLIPVSAHGTNPATARICQFEVRNLAINDHGLIDRASFEKALSTDVAGIMVTNPNTCGLFETDLPWMAERIHDLGGYVYCDGANFNAVMGKILPGELGIDAMHLNLHKTFSTPHGGGGPGSGPVVFSDRLAKYAPTPHYILGASFNDPISKGRRIKAFYGQMGMFIRALVYILSHGRDGLKQVAEDAVLNANYILACLEDVLALSFPKPCMHEVLFDDRWLKPLTTLDFSKALIDQGIHPMTMYFPLVVSGALLIEPTETESRESLDVLIRIIRDVVANAQEGRLFKNAPQYAPRTRFDEARAARSPILRFKQP